MKKLSNMIKEILSKQEYFIAAIILIMILYFYLSDKLKEYTAIKYMKKDINLKLMMALMIIMVLVVFVSIYSGTIISNLVLKYNNTVFYNNIISKELAYYRAEADRLSIINSRIEQNKDGIENLYSTARDSCQKQNI